uniref:Cobalamin biosynthesis protein n=1 Tax=Mesocestoides corti TaxID=53468 RepID=A0A5K3FI84_MESCO
MLRLIRVFLWLAADLPHIPLDLGETEDWLKTTWSNVSAPQYVATVGFGPMV